jgi:hypothetical protein
VLIADEERVKRRTVRRACPLDHLARAQARVYCVRVIARERDPNSHHVTVVAARAAD